MEIDNSYKQMLVLAVIILGALFCWFIPSIIKGIKNCLKRIFGGFKKRD